MRIVFIVFAVLIFASEARTGAVLRWVDERGVVHFTDNGASVPEQYRDQVDQRNMPEEREVSSENSRDLGEATKGSGTQHGRGEDYWIKRTNEVKSQLDRAQKEYRQVVLEYNELIAAYNATNSRAKRKQYKKQIESLQHDVNQRREEVERVKEILEKALPEEAKRAGAPVEWVK
jgi:hypothetical protein